MYLNIDNTLTYIDEKRIVGRFNADKLRKKDEKNFYDNYYTAQANLRKKYDLLNSRLILDAVKDDLIKLGGHYIKASFSGGHDEGGFDDFDLQNENEENIEIKQPWSKDITQWKIITHKEGDDEYYIENQQIKTFNFPDDLDEIFYNADCLAEWGSFAGEFHVNGHFLLNIHNGKWNMDGQESYESYEDITNEGQI